MGAQKRVPDRAIKEAIEATRGNLAQAADIVGLARVNFRKRLDNAGVGLEELARIRGVAQGSTRSLRLDADVFERLRQAKFDLQAKLRRDLDELEVLRLFLADRFDGWLDEQLGRKP